nr:hypothetical protein [Tanacetum cinerariifolium]
MAGFNSDFADPIFNAVGSVYDAAAEFAMMGISPKEVKLVESLARFDKWKESSKNLAKLINSSMTTRTKLGLGFKEYFGSDEVFDFSTPSVFDPEPVTREVKSLYERERLGSLWTDFGLSQPVTHQDSWRIRSWHLYPRAQVHVLEMVDGQVIHMFVDVSYPLSIGTLERMLKHRLEVSKLLVGGDLTMAEQLIGFIKAAFLNAKSAA